MASFENPHGDDRVHNCTCDPKNVPEINIGAIGVKNKQKQLVT